ncbi:hypothetical protein AXG93_3309s1080 [Marchantia polymorpha subsp. ruderalis]|uniref:Uncharacterized protein n=1 Tax=Marchantia polymorpha subsp. ruderalis TaxID=1480154 RepID=A0A176W5Z6_MARPO|nr:hypothetical protein AXG93_3309s1080 [Marchantia polymorpha subsp. ruderalis]
MKSKQVAIVTGANTGIGRETALALAKSDIKVFLACRNVDKGREAVGYIQDACPGADVEVLHLDMMSMDSIRKCASEFKSRKLPLNILVNNAGFNSQEPSYSPEGIGGSAQVSFLNKYEEGLYARTKLANALFAHEAQLRWQGQGIESSAVDPGSVYSDIWRNQAFGRPPFSWLLKALYAPTWDGAKPVIYAAIAPYSAEKKNNRPYRFFARGVFASPLITSSPPRVLELPVALATLFGSLIDWPVRRLTGGLIWGKVKEVAGPKFSYDRDFSSRLWKHAATVAGFSKE